MHAADQPFTPKHLSKCLPEKHAHLHKQLYLRHSDELYKRYLKRAKNWRRLNKKCNKLKKQLPPLPPGTPGDPRIYYKTTYNIELFDYKKQHQERLTLHVCDISTKLNDKADFVISSRDSAIINNPNIFFRRAPPPDADASRITVSDLSYTSAKSDITVIHVPLTPSSHH
ncbi:hypothetical protein RhiirC2_788895 [Rhizophagus irregularis]|uniref:Uncharacterized protein n=1 Tax=Rhizophagus irregularis TaxID=588596 RepID=A0A2N1MPA7_9GLOM|nr:hypothetical protein RhiirC2_788895 [Rhizophagus irregularis]